MIRIAPVLELFIGQRLLQQCSHKQNVSQSEREPSDSVEDAELGSALDVWRARLEETKLPLWVSPLRHSCQGKIFKVEPTVRRSGEPAGLQNSPTTGRSEVATSLFMQLETKHTSRYSVHNPEIVASLALLR